MSLRSSCAMIFETFRNRMRSNKCNLSVGSLCLGSICIGVTLGWPESLKTDLILQNCGKRCTELLANGSTSVQLIMTCGNCVGALVPSCIADNYGRKTSFAIAGTLNVAFWAIVISLEGRLEIIFVSSIGGIAAGIFVVTAVLYVSEISLPHTRASIGALAATCAYVGVLSGGCLIFVGFLRTISFIMICLTMFFLASLHWWMVESPYCLFLQGKTLDAKVSLKMLRGASTVLEIEPEYRTIELFFDMSEDNCEAEKPLSCFPSMMMSRKRRWALLVIVILCVTQMVSAYGMNDYLNAFLDVVLPDYGRFVIIAREVSSVLVWLCLIERINRKRLLFVISGIGASVSCLVLGVFTLVEERLNNGRTDYETSILLPALILALYYAIYSVGLIPILPVLTGEMFPSRCKTVALCFFISLIYLTSMIIQFIFQMLSAEQGANLAFASFAIFGAFSIPFAFIFLPELQGEALHEMHDELNDFTIILP